MHPAVLSETRPPRMSCAARPSPRLLSLESVAKSRVTRPTRHASWVRSTQRFETVGSHPHGSRPSVARTSGPTARIGGGAMKHVASNSPMPRLRRSAMLLVSARRRPRRSRLLRYLEWCCPRPRWSCAERRYRCSRPRFAARRCRRSTAPKPTAPSIERDSCPAALCCGAPTWCPPSRPMRWRRLLSRSVDRLEHALAWSHTTYTRLIAPDSTTRNWSNTREARAPQIHLAGRAGGRTSDTSRPLSSPWRHRHRIEQRAWCTTMKTVSFLLSPCSSVERGYATCSI